MWFFAAAAAVAGASFKHNHEPPTVLAYGATVTFFMGLLLRLNNVLQIV